MKFINGVDVLSETIIYVSKFDWGTGSIISLIVGIIVVFLLFWCGVSQEDGGAFIMGVGCIFLTILITGAIGTHEIPTDKKEYKVIISDQVNFNEFIDKYEIKNQEGKIYTIRIKEN